MDLNIAGIVEESIVDGPGIRYVVFTQGCPHHCPGCHNPETHSFSGGHFISVEDIFTQFQQDALLKGITFSGGEPFCQPEPLVELAKLVHGMGKDVAVFTGYTYEELIKMEDPAIRVLLDETDLLIDGPYLEDLRNLELRFRGSENQRLIDMNATRTARSVTLWEN